MHPARAHRSDGAEAQRHHVPADGHEVARGRGAPDQAGDRPVRVLRNVPRRGSGSGRQPPGRRERGLGSDEQHTLLRARCGDRRACRAVHAQRRGRADRRHTVLVGGQRRRAPRRRRRSRACRRALRRGDGVAAAADHDDHEHRAPGRHRQRGLDRQAVLQRAADAVDGRRRRLPGARRAHSACAGDERRLGRQDSGSTTSSIPSPGRSAAEPTRSCATSSASALWACPESQRWADVPTCPTTSAPSCATLPDVCSTSGHRAYRSVVCSTTRPATTSHSGRRWPSSGGWRSTFPTSTVAWVPRTPSLP